MCKWFRRCLSLSFSLCSAPCWWHSILSNQVISIHYTWRRQVLGCWRRTITHIHTHANSTHTHLCGQFQAKIQPFPTITNKKGPFIFWDRICVHRSVCTFVSWYISLPVWQTDCQANWLCSMFVHGLSFLLFWLYRGVCLFLFSWAAAAAAVAAFGLLLSESVYHESNVIFMWLFAFFVPSSSFLSVFFFLSAKRIIHSSLNWCLWHFCRGTWHWWWCWCRCRCCC